MEAEFEARLEAKSKQTLGCWLQIISHGFKPFIEARIEAYERLIRLWIQASGMPELLAGNVV